VDEETLRCEKCQRQLGPELLNCPYQAQGTCPYHIEHMPGFGATWKNWGCLILGLVVALAGLLAFFSTFYPPISLAVVGLGLLLTIFGVYAILGFGLMVCNKASGQMWHRVGLFGFKLSQFTASRLQPVAFEAKLSRPLKYPASISTLYQDQEAYTIFYMALLSLLSQGIIKLQYTTTSKVFFK
jgi:hypothetical protein